MRKIKSVLMAAFACVLFFGCSMDEKFKNTEWSGSIPYGIYNEETEKFDYYKAEVTLSLDSDLNGIFEIKVDKEVGVHQNERREVCGVLKEVMNESEGYYENWLICNYGENNLEFLIKEYQTPAPTHYVLEMTNHPIYAFCSLKEKNNYCWIRQFSFDIPEVS